MQLRVVGDQPWDVVADVLAVPYVGEPDFDGALAQINQRAGGELATLAAFGELKSDRYGSVLTAAGELRAGRLLAIGVGDASTVSRQVVVRLGSAIERRLAGRNVRTLAIWPALSSFIWPADRRPKPISLCRSSPSTPSPRKPC